MSAHVDFNNKSCHHIPITINDKCIPYWNTAKYLTLDAKLRWKAHVKKKREQLGLKYKEMYWLMWRRSALSIRNKLILYKQYWSLYGPTAYSCEDARNRFQNKALRSIIDKHWYIRNAKVHTDLRMEMVTTESVKFPKKHWRKASPPRQRRSYPADWQQWTGVEASTNWAGVVIINPLTPNDAFSGRTAPLTSKRCILYIYSTNIGTEYFKHCISSSSSSSSSPSIHSTTLGVSWSVQQFYSTPVYPLPSPSNQQFSSSLGLLLPGPSTLTWVSLLVVFYMASILLFFW